MWPFLALENPFRSMQGPKKQFVSKIQIRGRTTGTARLKTVLKVQLRTDSFFRMSLKSSSPNWKAKITILYQLWTCVWWWFLQPMLTKRWLHHFKSEGHFIDDIYDQPVAKLWLWQRSGSVQIVSSLLPGSFPSAGHVPMRMMPSMKSDNLLH